ncbi:hypothetical protein [Flavobacterium hibisci]|uniref:hypothetical protein n=1 Tax=Flavobacterium hibisci TaxID=1914462 RepID=UPI001CBF81EC|nr:hypothetical protein [Flavobacterium hibisci]MBZ4043849.1 hypothetical protein [Flavobacterium hibisci]
MKRLYLLLVMGFIHYSFGQTYSFDLYYSVATQKYCWQGQYGFSVRGGTSNAKISEQIKNKIHYVEDVYEEYFSVPNYNQFKITIKSTCFSNNGTSSCDGDETRTVSAIFLIKSGSVTLNRCVDESLKINNFKPNIIIQNLNTKNPSEVCAGSQLELAAFPEGFPDEAYHWQYSLDNQTIWIDVPNKMVNGMNINDTKVSKFTVYDILDEVHENYFGKDIYFRIGYGDRPFSNNVIQINYSACGPTVSEVSFKGPPCNGDIVESLSITFNEKLNTAIKEQIASLSVVDVEDDSKIFMQIPEPISYPDDTKKYTYTSFQQLENGHTYRIKYQAQIPNPNDASNPIMRGVLYSPEEFNFRYTEPAPLKFEIKKADNPICTDDLAEVSIAVTGGTGGYKFYVDGVEKTSPKPVKEADGYYHIRGLVPTAVNSIKVMDENDCIEKTL